MYPVRTRPSSDVCGACSVVNGFPDQRAFVSNSLRPYLLASLLDSEPDRPALVVAGDDRATLLRAAPHELCVLARPEGEPLGRQVHRFQEVRLPGAVRARDEHEPGFQRQLEPFVRAAVAE